MQPQIPIFPLFYVQEVFLIGDRNLHEVTAGHACGHVRFHRGHVAVGEDAQGHGVGVASPADIFPIRVFPINRIGGVAGDQNQLAAVLIVEIIFKVISGLEHPIQSIGHHDAGGAGRDDLHAEIIGHPALSGFVPAVDRQGRADVLRIGQHSQRIGRIAGLIAGCTHKDVKPVGMSRAEQGRGQLHIRRVVEPAVHDPVSSAHDAVVTKRIPVDRGILHRLEAERNAIVLADQVGGQQLDFGLVQLRTFGHEQRTDLHGLAPVLASVVADGCAEVHRSGMIPVEIMGVRIALALFIQPFFVVESISFEEADSVRTGRVDGHKHLFIARNLVCAEERLDFLRCVAGHGKRFFHASPCVAAAAIVHDQPVCACLQHRGVQLVGAGFKAIAVALTVFVDNVHIVLRRMLHRGKAHRQRFAAHHNIRDSQSRSSKPVGHRGMHDHRVAVDPLALLLKPGAGHRSVISAVKALAADIADFALPIIDVPPFMAAEILDFQCAGGDDHHGQFGVRDAVERFRLAAQAQADHLVRLGVHHNVAHRVAAVHADGMRAHAQTVETQLVKPVAVIVDGRIVHFLIVALKTLPAIAAIDAKAERVPLRALHGLDGAVQGLLQRKASRELHLNGLQIALGRGHVQGAAALGEGFLLTVAIQIGSELIHARLIDAEISTTQPIVIPLAMKTAGLRVDQFHTDASHFRIFRIRAVGNLLMGGNLFRTETPVHRFGEDVRLRLDDGERILRPVVLIAHGAAAHADCVRARLELDGGDVEQVAQAVLIEETSLVVENADIGPLGVLIQTGQAHLQQLPALHALRMLKRVGCELTIRGHVQFHGVAGDPFGVRR